MSKQMDKSFFMLSPLVKYAGFYQELLRGIDSYQKLGNRLIHLAERAGAIRQFDTVNEIGRVLSTFPMNQYQPIGHYYLAVGFNKGGKGDLDKAKSMLVRVADTASAMYRARAIHALAAVSAHQKDFDSELHFFVEALKASCDIAIRLKVMRGIAVHKAREGYHSAAVKDLERMLPLIKYAPPHIYFDYLNSLALELGEVGRKYEARNIIQYVVASPYAFAYPEWQETARELKEPNRSFISIPESLPKVERKPVEIEAEPLPTKKERTPADVLHFKKLKEAPLPEKPEGVSNIDLDDMTEKQKLDFIMTALRTGAIGPSRYNDIIYQGGMLKTGPSSKVLDLEDETIMTDKLIEWAHMIDPDDLAGVISLLRDCDDRLRQVNLMDAMIRKLFEYSSECGVSEEGWRKKVERRLPKK